MLTVNDVARHWQLRQETVRRYIRNGELPSITLGSRHRVEWQDVWALEDGTFPRGARMDRYREPLMSKRQIADRLKVSVKTIERWIDAGMAGERAGTQGSPSRTARQQGGKVAQLPSVGPVQGENDEERRGSGK